MCVKSHRLRVGTHELNCSSNADFISYINNSKLPLNQNYWHSGLRMHRISKFTILPMKLMTLITTSSENHIYMWAKRILIHDAFGRIYQNNNNKNKYNSNTNTKRCNSLHVIHDAVYISLHCSDSCIFVRFPEK